MTGRLFYLDEEVETLELAASDGWVWCRWLSARPGALGSADRPWKHWRAQLTEGRNG